MVGGTGARLRKLIRIGLGAMLGLALLQQPSHLSPATAHERATPADATWRHSLGEVDRALAADDVRSALTAWQRARRAALESANWEGAAAVADAYLRIGDAVELRRAFVQTARDTYLEALARAERAISVDGAVRIAVALAALEDRAATMQAIRVACAAAISTSGHARTHGACDPR